MDTMIALTRAWIPRTDVEWLEVLRMRHVGQVQTWERTKQALRVARGGDFEGLAEDERLAAELLAIVVEDCVSLIEQRPADPVVGTVEMSATTVEDVRRRLQLPVAVPDVEVAGVTSERPSTPVRPCCRASRALAPRAAGDSARSVANSSELAHVRGLAA